MAPTKDMKDKEGPLLEGFAPKKTKMQEFMTFMYNSEDHSVLGRTALSWAKIGLFYVVFYFCLAGFWASLLAIFFQTVSSTHPTYYGLESQTQNNPGMGVRPLPHFDTALIQFQQGAPGSYKPYTDHLDAFLEDYMRSNVKVAGSTVETCTPGEGGKRASADQACEFDVNDLKKGDCVTDYGFSLGRPCILIKMNKIYGFTPEPYTNRSELMKDHNLSEEDARFLSWAPDAVGVRCDGENNADRENIKSIKYYPEGALQGFPSMFFPYLNQEGYRAPIVFAVFESVSSKTLIQVNCQLFAKNIDNSGGKRQHGTLHFELIID